MNVHRQPTIDEIISLVQKQDSQAGKKPPEGGHTPELSPVVPAGEPEQERGLFLIVGLGNPGRKYLKNRHNVGFMVLDHLAEKLGVTFTRLRSKALVTEAKLDDRRLILAKPQGYMNTSGQVVGALVRFYKVSLTCCLVIHDDVDLPLGTLRLRPGGSSGGQKGVASIIERLGRQDFPRLRLHRAPPRVQAGSRLRTAGFQPLRRSLPESHPGAGRRGRPGVYFTGS